MKQYNTQTLHFQILIALSLLICVGLFSCKKAGNDEVKPGKEDQLEELVLTFRTTPDGKIDETDMSLANSEQSKMKRVVLCVVYEGSNKIEYINSFDASSTGGGPTTLFREKIKVLPGKKRIFAYAEGYVVNRWRKKFVGDRSYNEVIKPKNGVAEEIKTIEDLKNYFVYVTNQYHYGFPTIEQKDEENAFLDNLIFAGRKDDVEVLPGRENRVSITLYRQMAQMEVRVYKGKSFPSHIKRMRISMSNLPAAGRMIFQENENDLDLYKQMSPTEFPQAVKDLVIEKNETGSYMPFIANKQSIEFDHPEKYGNAYKLDKEYDENTALPEKFPDYVCITPPAFRRDWNLLSEDYQSLITIDLITGEPRVPGGDVDELDDANDKHFTLKFPIWDNKIANENRGNILPNRRYKFDVVLTKSKVSVIYHIVPWDKKEIDVPAFT